MVLTIVLLVAVAELSTFAEPVEIGTSSPTLSVATWLSRTTSEGFDSTRKSVTACSASKIKFGVDSDPIKKLNPGNALLSAAPTSPAALTEGRPGGDDGMLLTEPVPGLTPKYWL